MALHLDFPTSPYAPLIPEQRWFPADELLAAAFSLWMCAMRPAHPRVLGYPQVSPAELELFCASLNFWLASAYLSLFGDVTVQHDEDANVRIARIRYDFTYRNLNLSSLEMLYASIFRLRKE